MCLFLIEKHRGYPFQNLEFSLSPTMNIFNWFAFIPRAKWCFPDFCNYNSLIIYQVKKYCLIMLVCLLCKFVLRLEKRMWFWDPNISTEIRALSQLSFACHRRRFCRGYFMLAVGKKFFSYEENFPTTPPWFLKKVIGRGG